MISNIVYRLLNKFAYPIVNRVPLISRTLFLFRLLLFGKNRSQILILATITKTGTHYLRFLLTYYILLKTRKSKGESLEIENDKFLIDKALPNGWHSCYRFFSKYKVPDKNLKCIGLHDIPRSHMALKALEWRGFRVLHTYRNLLDQSVVSLETKYKCDSQIKDRYADAKEIFLDNIGENYKQYDSFAKGSVCGVNYLRVKFETIFRDPAETLALILMWLGYEPDLELCRLSSELALHNKTVLVGAGEKWQRALPSHIDELTLDEFIDKFEQTGAIDCCSTYFDESFLTKNSKYNLGEHNVHNC